jgi:hypothetical protein
MAALERVEETAKWPRMTTREVVTNDHPSSIL